MSETTSTPVPEHYTDEALREQLATGNRIGARGLTRKATYMLQIRPELRLAAALDANEFCNRVPGHTWCDALSVVIYREKYLPHVPAKES